MEISIYLILHHYALACMQLTYSEMYKWPGGTNMDLYIDLCSERYEELTTVLAKQEVCLCL